VRVFLVLSLLWGALVPAASDRGTAAHSDRHVVEVPRDGTRHPRFAEAKADLERLRGLHAQQPQYEWCAEFGCGKFGVRGIPYLWEALG
jgi:hypothetical protein